jgi:squalene monooxygenase
MIDAQLPIPGYALGVLGNGSPVLIYQISTRESRILIDIPYKVQEKLGGSQEAVKADIKDRVLPSIPKTIQPSLQNALTSGQIRNMPCSWLSSAVNRTPGLAMLGDSSNMRHPVTGAGMTVALKDVVLLAEMLITTPLEDTVEVQDVFKRFYWKRKRHSASLNILAQALYFLFASEGILCSFLVPVQNSSGSPSLITGR